MLWQYTHVALVDLAAVLETLPSIVSAQGLPHVQATTGTAGAGCAPSPRLYHFDDGTCGNMRTGEDLTIPPLLLGVVPQVDELPMVEEERGRMRTDAERVSDGTRTRDSQSHSLETARTEANTPPTLPTNPKERLDRALTKPIDSEPTNPAPTDPDLARIVEAWSGFSEQARKAVLALVDALQARS